MIIHKARQMNSNNQGSQNQIFEHPPPPYMAIPPGFQPKPASAPSQAPLGMYTAENNYHHWPTNQTHPGMSMNYSSMGYGGCAGGSADEEAEKLRLRKMKNRASAARSNAKAQAYNTKMEAEIIELKKENEILRKVTKVLSVDLERKEDGGEKPSLKRSFSGPL